MRKQPEPPPEPGTTKPEPPPAPPESTFPPTAAVRFVKACRCRIIDGGAIATTGALRLEMHTSPDGQTVEMVAIYNAGPSCTMCGAPWRQQSLSGEATIDCRCKDRRATKRTEGT